MKRKIVIVDDDPTSNYISEFILSSMYHDLSISSFLDPLKALEKLPSLDLTQDSVILLDLNMPEMNGYEFVDSLKERGTDCKIVILTSSKNLMDKEYSKKYHQIKGFINKPLSKENVQIICADIITRTNNVH